jgi:hypothetical protein
MVVAPIQSQVILDSAARGSHRRKRKILDDAVQGRTGAGQKPHTVRVKASGEIAGRYEGKNARDVAMRTNVPRTLDMSVLSWKEQSPDAIAELREQLDREFEYVGYQLTVQGFRNVVKRFMKSKCSRLKKQYQEGHTACPIHIEEDQWTRLKQYWNTDSKVEKSRKMSQARSFVKALSTVD